MPPTTRRLLYAAAFLRATATAMGGVLLGFYLAARGLDASESGAVVGAGLAGVAAAAAVATTSGDRLGRRRLLAGASLLGALGGVAVALASSPLVLALAAFLGMVNGMGRDRGASFILDQAILPATATDRERTLVFAWYNVFQDLGHALGSLLAGAPLVLRSLLGANEIDSLSVALGMQVMLSLPPRSATGVCRRPPRSRRRAAARRSLPRPEPCSPGSVRCSRSTASAAASSRARCCPTSSSSASVPARPP